MRERHGCRKRSRTTPGGLLGAGLFLLSGLAAADTAPPECTRAALGQLSCQAGVRCECSYFRDSATTDTPGGYRWDCGIRRSRCEMPPATIDPWAGPYPSSIGIDPTIIHEYPPYGHAPEGHRRDRDKDRDHKDSGRHRR